MQESSLRRYGLHITEMHKVENAGLENSGPNFSSGPSFSTFWH